MAHSVAESVYLKCPRCEVVYTVDVWLIIDATEQSDLLERISNGTIHDFACPIGHLSAIDAPLLLYQPSAALPLAFFRTTTHTEEWDDEAAVHLLHMLSLNLGEEWHHDWINQVIVVPPRGVVALSEGDDIRQGEFAAQVRVNMALAHRAEQRYLTTGDPTALDQAVDVWEVVLNDPDFSSVPEQFRLAAFDTAGAAFLRRYWMSGRLSDIDRALALCQAAVKGSPPSSASRVLYQSNLGAVLRARYLQRGDLADLDAAISTFESALANSGTVQLDLAACQHNLGLALRNRYERTGEPSDLERAIRAFEVAVARTPPDSPDWAGGQNSLGLGLQDRYERTGNRTDLDAALAAYEAAVAQSLTGLPDREMYLNNLGTGLYDRYKQTGDTVDLERAVEAFKTAAAGAPSGSPTWAINQNSLGTGLKERYEQTGNLADLDAAIAAYEAAVAATAPNSPARVGYQNSLGNGLRVRYPRTSNIADLERAISAYRAAVDGTSHDSLKLAGRLTNLGTGLRDRYLTTRSSTDLEDAIHAFRAAVDCAPPGSPAQAVCLMNLGVGLHEHYQRTGKLKDLEAAVDVLRNAVVTTVPDSPDSVMARAKLGLALRDLYGRTGRATDLDAAIVAYEDALATLDRALLDSPTAFALGQQDRWAGLSIATVEALATAGRAADAMAVAEGSKSRLLAGLVGRSEMPAVAAIPMVISTDLAGREWALAWELTELDKAELAGGSAASPGKETHDARAAIVAELYATWDEMAAAGPEAAAYVAARRGDRLSVAVLAGLANAFGPGLALLSLFTTGERTLLFLWRAGADAPLMIEAPLDFDTLSYDYLANYQDEVLNRAAHHALNRPLTHRWRTLGQLLLGPLQSYLSGIDHLIIAPHNAYHWLPLHALWLSDANDTLLDHCAVSYVPGLSSLESFRRRMTWPYAPGVVFGYTPAGIATAEEKREREYFLGEAKDVARLLGVVPQLDSDATGAALDAATNVPLRLLHLSCHGYFDAGDPLASGVLLADGLYTARRFLTRFMPVELVTLSACQTGISGPLGGDEMAGFSMALLTAGARSLLLGLWSVHAQTTAQLMVTFYDRLRGAGRPPRMTKAEALRQTMLALRDGRLIPPQENFDPSDPYYWAPFVLVGDWR